jgi:hypothetical protein
MSLYNSADTTKTLMLVYENDSYFLGIASFRFNIPNGINSKGFTLTIYSGLQECWLRIQSISGFLHFLYSSNGKQWIEAGSEPNTSWLTAAPTHIGPCCWTNRTGDTYNRVKASIDAWSVTTP